MDAAEQIASLETEPLPWADRRCQRCSDHFGGTTWTPVAASGQTLFGAWPSGAGNVFVVGSNGTILHLEP